MGNNIFSSDDSEEESYVQKAKLESKKKSKPAPKKRKVREDSSDSVQSRDGFAKPYAQTLSSVTEPDSLDDSLSDSDEEEMPKKNKVKKRKLSKSAEKRDSSMESKKGKFDRDSSVESVKKSKPEKKKQDMKKKSDEKPSSDKKKKEELKGKKDKVSSDKHKLKSDDS